MNTEKNRRSRRRILFWGLPVLAILLAVCIWFNGNHIPKDIAKRAGQALTRSGFDPRFLQAVNGRVAILSGEIKEVADRERLVETVRSVRGVRRVDDRLAVIESEPARLSLAISGDRATLSGVMPDRRSVEKVVAAARTVYGQEKVKNQLIISAHIIQPEWIAEFQALLPALQTMTAADIAISDEGLTLSGVVASDTERTAIEQRAGDLLGNLKLNNRIVVKSAAVNPAPAGQIQLPTLYFKHARTELTDRSQPLLDEIVDTLKRRPDLRVEVATHTDSSGEEVLNADLSERRTQAIAQYLVSRGIDPGRLVQNAYSESRPVAENTTKEGRARNRRVEFKVIE